MGKVFIFLGVIFSLFSYQFNWQEELPNAYEEFEQRRQENPIVISLGPHCGLASRFVEYKIRNASFPFDWFVSSFDGLYELIKNDFHDFLNPKNFSFIENHIMWDRKYNLRLYHDYCPSHWGDESIDGLVFINQTQIDEHNTIYNKYCRRVARFDVFLNSGIPLFLLRVNMSRSEAFRLYELLRKKYPNGNITLCSLQVIPNGSDLDWGHPNIKHFSVGRDGTLHESGKSPHPDWERVFKKLGVL